MNLFIVLVVLGFYLVFSKIRKEMKDWEKEIEDLNNERN
jgi:hypothetical protein